MREDWTLLKKLIWLWRTVGGAAPILKTITGALLHITDALAKPAHELVAVLKPVQDLHGYDAPWPAGGGKNKVDAATAYADFANGDGTYSGGQGATGITSVKIPLGSYIGQTVTFSLTVTAKTGATNVWYIRGVINGTGNGGNDHNRVTANETLPKRIYQTFTPETADDIVAISYGSGDGTLTIKDIQLEIGSSMTDYAPYANVCPISGWTGANVYNYPRYNQLRRDDSATITDYGVTTAYNPTTHLVTITNNSRSTNFNSGADFVVLSTDPLVSGHIYAFIGPKEPGVKIVAASADVGSVFTSNLSRSNIYLRITSDYDFVNAHPIGNVYSFPLAIIDMTEMFGDAADTMTYEQVAAMFPNSYYPYQAINSGAPSGGTTLPINWQTEAGTIYGGTVTLNEDGSADVTPTIGVADLASLTWNVSSGGFYSMPMRGVKPFTSALKPICDIYPTGDTQPASQVTRNPDPSIGGRNTYACYLIHDTSVTTIDDLIAKLTGHYATYYIENPTPIHIPNVGSLYTYLGANNIWVDASDDLTLTYYADGNASDAEALGILLGGMYSPGGDVSDKDALNILLGN